MHKPLSQDEISTLNLKSTTMTRRDKLLRWADIVSKHPENLRLYSNLEHVRDRSTIGIDPSSAFGLAAQDPVLKDAGLRAGSVQDIEKFFELSLSDLHAFSCDCGGAILNKHAADRIAKLAGEPGIISKTIARLRA